LVEAHATEASSIEAFRAISEASRANSRMAGVCRRKEPNVLENARMPFGHFRAFLAMQSSRKTYCVSTSNRSSPGQLTTYALVEGACSRWQ
jgi:hypothetical protein